MILSSFMLKRLLLRLVVIHATSLAVLSCAGAGPDDCLESMPCAPEEKPNQGDKNDETLPSRSQLWKTCEQEAACSGGQACLEEHSSSYFGGGYPGGLCALECDAEPEVCGELAIAAVCVAVQGDDRAVCLRSCEPGGAEADACGSSARVACDTDVEGREGFCRRFCQQDGDCETDVCDLRTGSCRSKARTGGEFGSACDLADEDACAGVCVDVGAESGVCGHRCKLGGVGDCGTASAPGVCRFPPEGHGAGDIGFCARLCDQDADCFPPQVQCEPFSTQDVKDAAGAEGVCVPSGARL